MKLSVMRTKSLQILFKIIYSLIYISSLGSCSAPSNVQINETDVVFQVVKTRDSEFVTTELPGINPTNSGTIQSQKDTPTPKTQSSIMIDWRDLPVIPELISSSTIEIYKKGRKFHTNPYAFSVIGDCESSESWFLGDFEHDIGNYNLGPYQNLQTVINAFQGSYGRKSLAVGNGFNSASILSPFWANQDFCNMSETPLECEIRIHHPSFVLVLLGTNDIYNLEKYESNLHLILTSLIEQGIVPVLATKADNLEGNHQINDIISRLANEYEIPLWNFWRVVQPLSNQGLQDDKAHLTWAGNDFSDPVVMDKAWPWRNLTALQILDFLLKSVH